MEDQNSLLRKIWRGAFFTLFGFALAKVLGLAYKVIIARTGAYTYGLLSIGIGILSVLNAFAKIGLDRGVLRYVAYYHLEGAAAKIKGVITSALKLSLALAIPISLVFFLFAEKIAVTFFNNNDLTIVFKILALVIPFEALRGIVISATKGFQFVKYEVLVENVLKNTSLVIFTLLLVIFLGNAAGLAAAYLLSIAIATIAAFFLLERKVVHIFKSKVVSEKAYRLLLSFSSPLLFADILYALFVSIDTLMLGHFKSASIVGVYNAATPFSLLLYLVPLSLTTLFVPILTNFYQNQKLKEIQAVYLSIT
ncbi:oligosaccharide flippase family protein, partial [Candidatus Woesearchaeota archaeon]|nr:oligosaccharide flippase family protein [Candidatus Woesearchaeota archaeon]